MQIDVVLIMSSDTRWDGGFDLLLFGMFEFPFLCWQCWADQWKWYLSPFGVHYHLQAQLKYPFR